ncbi:phage tail protein [Paenibacillus spongiae]|uniref:Phage tail protein n=1 Tax=Paenibacillus spongiae TaxID=2909671 RepID=A0ABY5S1A6_9BACL|nr:phage tail protein [Paenibacillus spongiae]UVI27389.1 phage tail protein [Paenibacillus spongiae]
MANNEQNEYWTLPLNHRSAWEEGIRVNVDTGGNDQLAIRTIRQYIPDDTIEANQLPKGITLTGLAAGHCRTLYLLDAAAKLVYRFDSIERRYERFVDLQGYSLNPIAIAYAHGGIIVADRDGPHRLMHFAELNGQLTWRAGEMEDSEGKPYVTVGGLPFHPERLTVDASGQIYALDITQGFVYQFDRHGRFLTPIGIAELSGKQPSAITVSANGTLLVLEPHEKKVYVFAQCVFVSSFEVTLASPSAMAMDRDGDLYIGESSNDPVSDEGQYLHKYSAEGEHLDVLSAYSGPADEIAADESRRLYIADQEAVRITVLLQSQVLNKLPGSPLAVGSYYSQAFDKTESISLWHKLVIDADIPINAQLKVSYITDNDPAINVSARTDWSAPQINPKRMLILHQQHQYLWIRLTLIGSETESPCIRSVQAVFPRKSYLRYLPAVYQEDENSRDFLERYLSIFEAFMTSSERQIDTIARWFDANSVNGDFLRWLGSWLAIAYDENWPEDKLRRLIHAIPRLYGMRGTREGLEEWIRLFTGDIPLIVETFQLQFAEDPDNIALLERLFGTDPYSFCVLLKPKQVNSESEYRTVQKIVDTEKPAHTSGGITWLQPYIYLDMHTYVGINTVLTKPEARLGTGAIPRDTVLQNPTPYGQVGSSTLIPAYTALA